MRVRLFWPSCDLFDVGKSGTFMDAYWVEATREEAEADILPRLNQELQVKSHQEAVDDKFAKQNGNPPRPYCYVVTKDLSNIIPFNCRYPFHQLWNAYSPFGRFQPFLFTRLEELMDFAVPAEIDWLGLHTKPDSK